MSTPGVFWTFHCRFFPRKPALSKCEPEHLYLFAPDLPAVGHASGPTYNSIVFSNEGERNLSLRSIRPVEGFRVGKIRWQQSIANCAAEPDRVWLKPRTAFAYLIIQMRNGPGLEGDQFLQGSVCSNICTVAQEKMLSPPCPFYPVGVPSTVCLVFWVVKLTSCPARLGVEPIIASTAVLIGELLSITSCGGFRASCRDPRVAHMFRTIT